jgi:hypothetical protein
VRTWAGWWYFEGGPWLRLIAAVVVLSAFVFGFEVAVLLAFRTLGRCAP